MCLSNMKNNMSCVYLISYFIITSYKFYTCSQRSTYESWTSIISFKNTFSYNSNQNKQKIALKNVKCQDLFALKSTRTRKNHAAGSSMHFQELSFRFPKIQKFQQGTQK